MIAFFVVLNWQIVKRQRLVSPGIGLVVAAGLVGTGLSSLQGRVEPLTSLLYTLRPLEYWFVYPALAIILYSDRDRAARWLINVLAIMTIANAGVAALQYIGNVQIGFSKFSNQRGAGLTAGPYELGAISALMTCFWLSRKSYFLVALSLASILMSQSRISLVAVAVGAVLMSLASRRRRDAGTMAPHEQPRRRPEPPSPALVSLATTAALLLVFVAPVLQSTLVKPALERAQGTSVVETWRTAESVVERTSRVPTSASYVSLAYDGIGESILDASASGDASSAVRFFRWQLLFRETLASPITTVFGLGPSFPGPSVDGALLRIFFETGVMGVAAWLVLFRRWTQGAAPWLIAGISTVLVGSLFIDVLFAMRPMIVLWSLIAVSQASQEDVAISTPRDSSGSSERHFDDHRTKS